MLRELVADSLDRQERYNVRYRIVRPDTGQILWMFRAAVLIRDEKGAIERVIGVLRDISDRKAEEDEREALVAELDHRVKNVLASVQSMAAPIRPPNGLARRLPQDLRRPSRSHGRGAYPAHHRAVARRRHRPHRRRRTGRPRLGPGAMGGTGNRPQSQSDQRPDPRAPRTRQQRHKVRRPIHRDGTRRCPLDDRKRRRFHPHLDRVEWAVRDRSGSSRLRPHPVGTGHGPRARRSGRDRFSAGGTVRDHPGRRHRLGRDPDAPALGPAAGQGPRARGEGGRALR